MQRNQFKKFGNDSEDLATKYMENLGYKIVERNYYARKLGEIDIIAYKDDVWHFVEVKSANKDFDPIYNISPTKLHKIINSVYYYLKQKHLDVAFSIDALIIKKGKIELIENITM